MYGITLNNVNFAYEKQLILSEVDLTIEPGDFFCLLGQSGSGKSTLLRIIAGLSVPLSGRITLDEKPIYGPGIDRGIVFQDYSLFPWLRVGPNIVLALEQAYPHMKKAERNQLASDYLEMVGLPEVFHKLPGELSGGMRQRAAIARVFALNSPILLMDEPFGALDAITRVRLQDLLLELWQQKGRDRKTVVFVTHDVEEALFMANKIAVMSSNPGRIKEVISVNLPRPRVRKQLYTNKEFQTLRDHLIGLLYEDIFSVLEEDHTVASQGDFI
ncbi:MAG: Bicarbonate transport ATP-binding protein CmpD [Syntrophorhabdaceae bacterium PtaU1.Bin034]|jgi:ABC-type nitrate/sulfonate/bicarbonate transport system ATPase subunit|nr:MAG: Bicarbonate transport ATP-binding protein CmpD [Syntrophorhabdaceae bacterium PtaU1.Bin034]